MSMASAPPEKQQAEIEALKRVVEALLQVSPDGRDRILRYAASYFTAGGFR